ncbi:hypothetical protein DPMN_160543, partial [Dreissena polymorpha]
PRESFTRLDVFWNNHPNVKQTVIGTPKLQPTKLQGIPIKISLLDIIRHPRKVIDVLKNFDSNIFDHEKPTRSYEDHDKASPCSSDPLEQNMEKPEKESSKVASTAM